MPIGVEKNGEGISSRLSKAMNTKVMRALRFAEFGPPSVLRIEDVAIPEPGYDEGVAPKEVLAELNADKSGTDALFPLRT